MIMAPKIGVWAGGGLGGIGMGINFLYYTNFSEGQAVFRPEVGFGMQAIKIYYGYNLKLGHSGLEDLSHSVFGITIWFNKRLRK
jgi:hypothetical protein